MIIALIFIYTYPIPEHVLYQYQPYTLTLFVGLANIGLTVVSLGLLALACNRRAA
jgi:hypothetical protein